MKRLLITAVILALGGCAAKTSPERHSIYYARHDPTMMGGNYASSPDATAKANLPAYKQIYQQGQDAKTKGLTPAQAQTLADEIYKVNANVTSGTETFMNLKEHKTQITRDERASQLWGQTLKETFLDGFNGVK
jgi:cell fate (sporulation/competence/biofilm development) regulator YlbF (YheA/YmcA/DUF963 family)